MPIQIISCYWLFINLRNLSGSAVKSADWLKSRPSCTKTSHSKAAKGLATSDESSTCGKHWEIVSSDFKFVVNEVKFAKPLVCPFKNCYIVIQQCSTHNKFFSGTLSASVSAKRFLQSIRLSLTAFCWEFIHRKCALLFHARRPCEENINAVTHNSAEALYTQPHTYRQIHCTSAYKGRGCFFFHLLILHTEWLSVTLHRELQDHSTMEK